MNSSLITYGIPVSVANVDEVADFFSIYAAHSMAILRPAVLDSYSYNYFCGSESREMLEIILNSRTYDPGYHLWSLAGDMTSMISFGRNNATLIIVRRENIYAGETGEIAKFIGSLGGRDPS